MPFLPDDSKYIGECKECGYDDPKLEYNGPCPLWRSCDPIGGINYWEPKENITYEEWLKKKGWKKT